MLALRVRALAVLLSASLVAPAFAQSSPTVTLPAGVTRGASVEGITEYHLSNGLRVLLFPDPTKSTTTVNITYLVGSRNEDYGETGMAHLLEHLLFKGSPRHRNIPQELSEHGARPNGTTSYDRTNYFETFQSSDANLNWALDLEADRMVNSFIAKSDLDSEMTVVRNEFERGENSALNVLVERVQATGYLWHNYGKSTIGARSDIEHVPIDRLQNFYHRYYQPDNAVLTVAGHLNEAPTLALIARYFGSTPKPTRVLPPTYTEEPVQDGERSVTLRRAGDNKAVVIGIHVPAAAHPDNSLANIVGDVLADAPSGRLYKALVETRKVGFVAASVPFSRDPGMLLLYASAPVTANLDEIHDIMLHTVDEMIANPPTAAEVNRIKAKDNSELNSLIRNSEQLGLFLSEFIAAGDWRLAFLTRDRIRDASVADVDRVAKTYLVDSNRTVGLFIPTEKPIRADIPATPDVNQLVSNYKGGEALAAGEAFDPSPANIDKRTIRGDLQPGIKLAIVSKKTRGAVVNATVRLHFGDENTLRGKDSIGSLAAGMLMRGTTSHTRQQIDDEFSRLQAQVRVIGSASGATVYIETTKINFAPTMDLVADILRHPAFPAAEFEALKRQRLTALESQRSEPDQIASTNAERHIRPYPKGDIRHVEDIDEEVASVNAVTLPEIQAFHKQFYGIAKAEVAAVGDVDAEALQKQLIRDFGDWKSSTPYRRINTNYKSVPAVNQSFETPDKANATLVAVLPFKMDDTNPDYPALTLANYMLGGGFLNSRLATRIRVKDGLSYGVGSQVRVSPGEDGAAFQTFAISAPQNTARVEADFQEEIKAAVTSGFTDKELTAAKSGWLQSRQVSRSQDGELVGRLAAQAYWGRTMEFDARFENAVKSLTVDQVNAALRKYIDPKQISIFKAGDFAKAKAAPAPNAAPASK